MERKELIPHLCPRGVGREAMGSGRSRRHGLTLMTACSGEESGLRLSVTARSGIPALGTGSPRCREPSCKHLGILPLTLVRNQATGS